MRKIRVHLHGDNYMGHVQEITCPTDIVSIDIIPVDDEVEPEKPARIIDGCEFTGWHFDKHGQIRNGRNDLLVAFMDSIPAKIQRRAPEIMGALIDIVSSLQNTSFLPQHRDVLEKARWLISDMGFEDDIKERG